MSLDFLSVDAAREHDGGRPVARSPVEQQLVDAGATLSERDGWAIATGFGSLEAERRALREGVGVGDRSHLGKLELQGPPAELQEIVSEVADGASVQPRLATRAADAWWCPVSAQRLLVVCEPGRTSELRGRLQDAATGRAGTTVADLTSALAASVVAGPRARDLFARLTALDLRQGELPERGFAPGSVARVPAMLLRERGDRFLLLTGSAQGEYLWEVAIDAGAGYGVAPVGSEALAEEEATTGA